ncbi:MAG: hypothetical protein D6770_01865 [Anaerolineae bacterium]|nr:MAG: hypothetical protein D6770_01865 [Anaerolineae bacterium]
MSKLINHYSAVWMAAVLVALVAFLLLRNKPSWPDFLAFGLLLAGVIVAWLMLRPVQTPLAEDAQRVQEAIGGGTPVLLEFQSPY